MEYKRKKTWKLIWTGSHRRGGFVNSGLHNSFEHFRMMKWNSWAMLSYNNPWGWKGVMPIWRRIWNLVVCASISSHPLCMTSFPRMYCVASSGRDVGKPVDGAEDSWPSLPQPTQTLKTQCPHWPTHSTSGSQPSNSHSPVVVLFASLPSQICNVLVYSDCQQRLCLESVW